MGVPEGGGGGGGLGVQQLPLVSYVKKSIGQFLVHSRIKICYTLGSKVKFSHFCLRFDFASLYVFVTLYHKTKVDNFWDSRAN